MNLQLLSVHHNYGLIWSNVGDCSSVQASDFRVCLRKVLDKSGIKIRRGVQVSNTFFRLFKQPLKSNHDMRTYQQQSEISEKFRLFEIEPA